LGNNIDKEKVQRFTPCKENNTYYPVCLERRKKVPIPAVFKGNPKPGLIPGGEKGIISTKFFLYRHPKYATTHSKRGEEIMGKGKRGRR